MKCTGCEYKAINGANKPGSPAGVGRGTYACFCTDERTEGSGLNLRAEEWKRNEKKTWYNRPDSIFNDSMRNFDDSIPFYAELLL